MLVCFQDLRGLMKNSLRAKSSIAALPDWNINEQTEPVRAPLLCSSACWAAGRAWTWLWPSSVCHSLVCGRVIHIEQWKEQPLPREQSE